MTGSGLEIDVATRRSVQQKNNPKNVKKKKKKKRFKDQNQKEKIIIRRLGIKYLSEGGK